MNNPVQIVQDVPSDYHDSIIEKSAIMSIMKDEPFIDKNKVHYTVQLTFLGSIILPPYLPRKDVKQNRKVRQAIIEALRELEITYTDAMTDLELAPGECKAIHEQIVSIGWDIRSLFGEDFFEDVSELLHSMDIRHVIFHSDDFVIPWPWIYYTYGADADFLINRFSCGMLKVDTDKSAMNRLAEYDVIFPSRLKKTKMHVRFFGGELVRGRKGTVALSRDYVHHFKKIFDARDEIGDAQIKYYTADDWRHHVGKPDQFVSEFLGPKVSDAKVIHFSGFIRDGNLIFGEGLSISPELLARRLPSSLEHNPLVVLHGCSASLFKLEQEERKQLSTLFLERGASGCLIALLPAEAPILLDDSPHSMMDRFYQEVIKNNTPYGHALLSARHDFQNHEETAGNPQWLFFHYYGDPRARLFNDEKEEYQKTLDEICDVMLEIDRPHGERSPEPLPPQEPKKLENIGKIIFLSHATDDRGTVKDLYNKLKHQGYRPWMSPEDIRGGTNFVEAIFAAISSCDIFVACLSKNFAASKFVAAEVDEVLRVSKQKRFNRQSGGPPDLIPLKLARGCDVPDSIGGNQWIDYYEPDGFDRLLKSLEPS
jgi:hypothetical protein